MKDILGRDIREGQYIAHTNNVSGLGIYRVVSVGAKSYKCEHVGWNGMQTTSFRGGDDLLIDRTSMEVEYKDRMYMVLPHEYHGVTWFVSAINGLSTRIEPLTSYQQESLDRYTKNLEAILDSTRLLPS